MWRRGWCRNPRLYSPQQSHLVDQDSLDCNRGLGHAWEPIDDDVGSGEHAPITGRQPLRLFAPQPGLAAAGVGMMASSGFGPGGEGGAASPSGSPRSDRPTAPGGQERTVSFQPEERYWTDYLRIALPAIGLVLLIGVFWYWAGALIGQDDGGGDGQATEVTLADVPDIDASPAVPTSSPVPALAPSPGPPLTPATNAAPPTPVRPTPTEESAPPTESTRVPTDRLFPVDSTVVTTGDVNLRREPSSGDNIIKVLPEGTELRITGAFVDAGAGLDYDWYPVEVIETGEQGFVNEEFLAQVDG